MAVVTPLLSISSTTTLTQIAPRAIRRAAADDTRDYGVYDDEAIAAVDKFRVDHALNYQGAAAGLVDARLIDALRAAYLAKKKSAPRP